MNIFDGFYLLSLPMGEKKANTVFFQLHPEKEKVEQNAKKKDEALLPDNILQFCYSDLPLHEAEKELEEFSFILTSVDSSKRFGFCRRVNTQAESRAYCFISNRPYYQMFYHILSICYNEEKTSGITGIKNLLPRVSQLSPSSSEKSISLNISIQPCEININRGYTEFGDISPNQFLGLLSEKNIIKAFAALVCERRFIVSSSDLSRLSTGVICLNALLHPFRWQNIFIPLLPPSLHAYCCAPMPFIVGVHSSGLIPLQSLPLEETVFVDLDNNKVVSDWESQDVALLPSEPKKELLKNLKMCRASAKKRKSDIDSMTFSIALFWKAILGPSVRGFLNTSSPKKKFERQNFLSSIQNSPVKNSAKFIEVFSQSQMYSQWERGIEENEQSVTEYETLMQKAEEFNEQLRVEAENTGGQRLKSMFHSLREVVSTKPTREERASARVPLDEKGIIEFIQKKEQSSSPAPPSRTPNTAQPPKLESTEGPAESLVQNPPQQRRMTVRVAMQSHVTRRYTKHLESLQSSPVIEEPVTTTEMSKDQFVQNLEQSGLSSGLISANTFERLKSKMKAMPENTKFVTTKVSGFKDKMKEMGAAFKQKLEEVAPEQEPKEPTITVPMLVSTSNRNILPNGKRTMLPPKPTLPTSGLPPTPAAKPAQPTTPSAATPSRAPPAKRIPPPVPARNAFKQANPSLSSEVRPRGPPPARGPATQQRTTEPQPQGLGTSPPDRPASLNSTPIYSTSAPALNSLRMSQPKPSRIPPKPQAPPPEPPLTSTYVYEQNDKRKSVSLASVNMNRLKQTFSMDPSQDIQVSPPTPRNPKMRPQKKPSFTTEDLPTTKSPLFNKSKKTPLYQTPTPRGKNSPNLRNASPMVRNSLQPQSEWTEKQKPVSALRNVFSQNN